MESLQDIVGGHIQQIRIKGQKNVVCLTDEDGKMKNKQINQIATAICRAEGSIDPMDMIVGDVIFCGSAWGDVPKEYVKFVESLL